MNGTDGQSDSKLAAEIGPSRWIAYELHDSLLQWVIGARMQLELAMKELPSDPAASNVGEPLSAAMSLLDLAMLDGRKLIDFIESGVDHPQQSLHQAIEAFVAAMPSDPAITLSAAPHAWAQLGVAERWHTLRIVQQAVANALQHAQATAIRIELTAEKSGALAIDVSDDGQGFDTTQTRRSPTGHYGLSSMYQRAAHCGWELNIVSSPGEGCRVRLRKNSAQSGRTSSIE